MPKNAEDLKSKMRLRSSRKPFRDVSNVKTSIKSASNCKNISKDDGGQAGDDSLNRLLLVHSDLSSLLRKIDELVVQALQMTGNDRKKEIKQFADVLSDMQTSLKPWVSRFQKTVYSQSTGLENISEQPVERKTPGESRESTNTAVESPEKSKWESLVSPSPLVAGGKGNTEGGRQLFLLTPLPQERGLSSKLQESYLRVVEEISPVALCGAVRNMGDDLHVGVPSVKPTPKVAFDIQLTQAARHNMQAGFASPEKVSNANCPLFIMTPCMKMSPPKSCILLGPTSAFSRKQNQLVHKSTPFPTGVHNFGESEDSESSSIQSSDELKLKYPELYGIKTEIMQKKMEEEDSPNWIVSPPKTCAVMDFSNTLLLNNRSDHCMPLVSNQEGHLLALKTKESESEGGHATTSKSQMQDVIHKLDLAEFTPMVKEPMSSILKREHPGENTLKKELWTKFEAATTHGFCFSNSLSDDTRVFLDILDEASDA